MNKIHDDSDEALPTLPFVVPWQFTSCYDYQCHGAMVLGQVIMRHKLHLMKVIFLDEILPLHPECMWAMPKVSGKQMSITNTGQFRDNMRPLHHTGEEECSICKTINSETGRPTAVAASRRLVSSTIFTNLPKEDQVQKNETLCATLLTSLRRSRNNSEPVPSSFSLHSNKRWP